MSAPIYNLINDFVQVPSKTGDMISVSPHWILYVVSLKDPLTYSRKDSKQKDSLDFSGSTRSTRTIITSDCISLNVSNPKESHTKGLNAVLLEGNINYLSTILPGDWIMAWMVNDVKRYSDIIEALKKGEPANGFNSGLKFVGRVDSVRKQLSVGSGSGIKHVEYQLSAFAFKELDSQLFYDVHIAEAAAIKNSLPDVIAKIGLNLSETLRINNKQEQQNNIHIIIPGIIKLLLGKGANSKLNNSILKKNGVAALRGAVDTGEAPGAYTVPAHIGTALGRTKASKAFDLISYCDILEVIVGVQKYENQPQGDNKELGFTQQNDITNGTAMNPTVKQNDAGGNQKFTGTGLLGAYILNPMSICNNAIWSILNQYLNPTINEIYTALRVNQNGTIVPTIVLRQIPFTTPMFAKVNAERQDKETREKNDKFDTFKPKRRYLRTKFRIPVTEFHNLPRWRADDALIKFINIGRSDASRTNFIHVYGSTNEHAGGFSIPVQIALNPPISDNFDISRNGLRTFMAITPCLPINQAGAVPGQWMDLIADRLIGSHLTLNGHISLQGIQAPICEGDNFEWDNTVYHIESVAHSCSINPVDGRRTFSTSLTLVNGLKATTNSGGSEEGGSVSGDEDFSDTELNKTIYPGILIQDNVKGNPGKTVEEPEQPQFYDEADVKKDSKVTKGDPDE